MANPDNAHGFRPERVNGGTGAIPLEEVQVDTDCTCAIGDPLVIDADGYGSLAGSTSTGILGVAAEAATATSGVRPTVSYWPSLEQIVFSGQCSGTPTIATIGTQVSIEGSTGVYELDEDDTDPGVARIIGLKPGSSMGLNAELLFVWRASDFSGQA